MFYSSERAGMKFFHMLLSSQSILQFLCLCSHSSLPSIYNMSALQLHSNVFIMLNFVFTGGEERRYDLYWSILVYWK